MSEPPQAGFDTANENGNIPIPLTDQIAVNHGGIIGPFTHDTAGSKGIILSSVLGDGIMVDHGIHITAGNQKPQPGSTVNINRLRFFPVRLRNDTHAIPMLLQHTADNGMPKGGMIHISIADHINKIAGSPTPINHILLTNRKKAHKRPPKDFSTV